MRRIVRSRTIKLELAPEASQLLDTQVWRPAEEGYYVALGSKEDGHVYLLLDKVAGNIALVTRKALVTKLGGKQIRIGLQSIGSDRWWLETPTGAYVVRERETGPETVSYSLAHVEDLQEGDTVPFSLLRSGAIYRRGDARYMKQDGTSAKLVGADNVLIGDWFVVDTDQEVVFEMNAMLREQRTVAEKAVEDFLAANQIAKERFAETLWGPLQGRFRAAANLIPDLQEDEVAEAILGTKEDWPVAVLFSGKELKRLRLLLQAQEDYDLLDRIPQ